MTEKEILNERIQKTAHILGNFDGFLKETIGRIPGGGMISKEILSKVHEEAKVLAEVLENPRPPRFLLVGKTGVGKSSLLNAMLGEYVAEVSAVETGTKEATIIPIISDGKTVMEVVDTRGVFESIISGQTKAEADLQKTIEQFQPDAALFVFRAKDRAHLDTDVRLIKEKLTVGLTNVPLIAVVSQIDELDPAREKLGSEYSSKKLQHIEDAVTQIKKILDKEKLDYVDVIPVSAYMEWETDEEKPGQKKCTFDARYNIEKLLDVLENNLEVKAQIGLLLCTRGEQALKKIAVMVVKTISGISSTIAVTPIPVADVFPLLALQISMITLISYLAGKKLDFDGAKDFVLSLGIVGVGGYTFRLIARQLAKLIPIPGAGSVIGASVAYTGTSAIGNAAIAYYFDKVLDKERLKEIVKIHLKK